MKFFINLNSTDGVEFCLCSQQIINNQYTSFFCLNKLNPLNSSTIMCNVPLIHKNYNQSRKSTCQPQDFLLKGNVRSTTDLIFRPKYQTPCNATLYLVPPYIDHFFWHTYPASNLRHLCSYKSNCILDKVHSNKACSWRQLFVNRFRWYTFLPQQAYLVVCMGLGSPLHDKNIK